MQKQAKMISPRRSPVRKSRISTATNRDMARRPGWNASPHRASPQRSKTEKEAAAKPFLGYEMQSYRGMKIDYEIQNLAEPERTNMQMQINEEVDRLVHQHMSSYSREMHESMQQEREKQMYRIEQFQRRGGVLNDLNTSNVSKSKNTVFHQSPISTKSPRRGTRTQNLNQDLEDDMKGIKAPNIGLKENSPTRKSRVYVLPDGSVANTTTQEIKQNPYNTMMYPHGYGYPGHMGIYGHGSFGRGGYGGYSGYGQGHHPGQGYGGYGHPGYGGYGYAGNGIHHPYGAGYAGNGWAHGTGNQWRGYNNYEPWQFGQFGACFDPRLISGDAPALTYEIASSEKAAASPTRTSIKSTKLSKKGQSEARKMMAGQTIQYINPNRYNSVFRPGTGSVPVDFIEEIYFHLDPISVGLQERVKFGGHITSEVKQPYKPGQFFFDLTELKQPAVKISKMAILSATIEKEESRGFKKKKRFITKNTVDKNLFRRDPQQAKLNQTLTREDGELSRRENNVSQHQDKYYDPDAYEEPHRFFQRHMGLLREDGINVIEPVAVDVNITKAI